MCSAASESPFHTSGAIVKILVVYQKPLASLLIVYPQSHLKMFQCDQCSFSSSKKYNLERHVKNIHGNSQRGSGALLTEQTNASHVPQEILPSCI